MKSQDILLLFKLICLSRLTAKDLLVNTQPRELSWNEDGRATKEDLLHIDSLIDAENYLEYLFTTRGLAQTLGISKSEISNSLARCINVSLAKISRVNQKPEVNKKTLFDFIKYGLRLVYPVKPAEITRGIPTTFAAPVLKGKLLSGGELIMVWPDSMGKEMGQAIIPLYKSVPFAVRQDPELYAYLALLDAIRLGSPREMKLALEQIEEKIFHDGI